MAKLVRLYPHAPRVGWVLKTYTLIDGGKSIKFVGERGWYEVDDALAEKLEGILQESNKPKGPRAFMVAEDKDDAARLDAEAKEILSEKKEESIGTVDAPVRLHRPGARASGPAQVTPAKSEGGEGESSPGGEPGSEADRTPASVGKRTRARR